MFQLPSGHHVHLRHRGHRVHLRHRERRGRGLHDLQASLEQPC